MQETALQESKDGKAAPLPEIVTYSAVSIIHYKNLNLLAETPFDTIDIESTKD